MNQNQNQKQDERILMERRKIQSRAYAWLIYLLLLSVLVQQFFLKAPFAQYSVEFFMLVGCGLYNLLCNYVKGIDLWNSTGMSKKKIFINVLFTGILSVCFFYILSGEREPAELAVYFTSFILFFFLIRILMEYIMKKRQRKIDQEMDDDNK